MCSPELSDIENFLWQEVKNNDVTIIGISNEPEATIRQFVQDQRLTFPILRDTEGVYSDYYIPGGISPYPRDFIIDEEGIVRYANTEYDIRKMVAVLQSLRPDLDISQPDPPDDLPDPAPEEPDEFESTELFQNYPNPFAETTTISFQLSVSAPVKINIYNLLGEKIRTVLHAEKPAGPSEVTWNGKDDHGLLQANGVYFVEMRVQNQIYRKKLIYLR